MSQFDKKLGDPKFVIGELVTAGATEHKTEYKVIRRKAMFDSWRYNVAIFHGGNWREIGGDYREDMFTAVFPPREVGKDDVAYYKAITEGV